MTEKVRLPLVAEPLSFHSAPTRVPYRLSLLPLVAVSTSPLDYMAVPLGVTVVKDFLSTEEEASIVEAIDRQPWANSQSGRQKQVGSLYATM